MPCHALFFVVDWWLHVFVVLSEGQLSAAPALVSKKQATAILEQAAAAAAEEVGLPQKKENRAAEQANHQSFGESGEES